jgi:tape measure domain-containing protein
MTMGGQPIESLFIELDARIADIEGKITNSMRGAERAASNGEARLAAIYRRGGLRMAFFGEQAGTASAALAVPLIAAGTALGAFGAKALMAAGQMESTKVAFKSLLGGAEEANKFIRQMADFAAKTPFEFVGLTNAARSFMAFGVQSEKIIPIMTAMGDAVAKVGGGQAQIDRITIAFTQMMSTGRLNAQDMMQLANAGIQAWPILASAMGKSVQEVRAMAEKGQISGAQAVETLLIGMQKSSAGMMEKLSGTYNQLLSNFKDVSDQTMISIGDAIENTFGIKGKMGDAIKNLEAFKDRLDGAKDLKDVFVQLLPPEFVENVHLIAGAFAGALTPAIFSFSMMLAGAVGSIVPFMAAGIAVALLGQRIFGSWEGFFNAIEHGLDQVDNLITYLTEVVTTGNTVDYHFLLLNDTFKDVATVLVNIINFIKVDLIPALTTTVKTLWDFRAALIAVTLAFVVMRGAAALAAGQAGLALFAASVGKVIYALKFLVAFKFAVLTLISPFVAVGLAVLGVGLLITGLATNFMGMRDTAFKVLGLIGIKFLDLAQMMMEMNPFIMIARMIPGVSEKIDGFFDSLQQGIVDWVNANQEAKETEMPGPSQEDLNLLQIAANAYDNYGESIKGTAQRAANLRMQEDELNDALGLTNKAQVDLTGAFGGGSDAMDKQKNMAEKLRKAYLDLISALGDKLSAAFNATMASIGLGWATVENETERSVAVIKAAINSIGTLEKGESPTEFLDLIGQSIDSLRAKFAGLTGEQGEQAAAIISTLDAFMEQAAVVGEDAEAMTALLKGMSSVISEAEGLGKTIETSNQKIAESISKSLISAFKDGRDAAGGLNDYFQNEWLASMEASIGAVAKKVQQALAEGLDPAPILAAAEPLFESFRNALATIADNATFAKLKEDFKKLGEDIGDSLNAGIGTKLVALQNRLRMLQNDAAARVSAAEKISSQYLEELKATQNLEFERRQEALDKQTKLEQDALNARMISADLARKKDEMLEQQHQAEMRRIMGLPATVEDQIRQAAAEAAFFGKEFGARQVLDIIKNAFGEDVLGNLIGIRHIGFGSGDDEDVKGQDLFRAGLGSLQQFLINMGTNFKDVSNFFIKGGIQGSYSTGPRSFAEGGVTPWAAGVPQLAMLHGQERVLSQNDNSAIVSLLAGILSATKAGQTITLNDTAVGSTLSESLSRLSRTPSRMGAGLQ